MKNQIILKLMSIGLFAVLGANYGAAQDVDSLFARYIDSRGAEHLRLANELSHRIFELGHIYTDYKFSASDEPRAVDATNYGSMALYKFDHSEYADAIALNLKSLNLLRSLRDSSAMLQRLLNLYVNYSCTDQLDKAAKVLNESLDIATRRGDKQMIAHSLLSLGDLHQRDERWETAMENILKALEMYRQLGNEKRIITCYAGLSGFALNLNRFDEAYRYAVICDSLARAVGNIYSRKEGSAALANMYIARKEWAKALAQIDSSLAIAEEADNPAWVANEYVRRGEVLVNSNAPTDVAAKSLLDGIAIAEQLNRSETVTLGYDLLYKLYRKSNPALSLEYLEKMLQVKHTQDVEATQKEITNMQVKYETREKEFKIKILEEERRLNRTISQISYTALLLALAALFFAWRMTVQKRRKAEIQIKQFEQEKQLLATQLILEGETAERRRLASDLHDGLGGMLSCVKLNLMNMKQGQILETADVVSFEKALLMLDKSICELRRVAHNMMPESLSRCGLKSALADFCDSVPTATFNWIGESTRLDSKLEVMVYRVVCELVNNAMKHAGAAHIFVQMVQDASRISFTVEDDGCGFDTNVSYSGVGWNNIRTRMAAYGGRLELVSTKGEGTEVEGEVSLPANGKRGA